MAIKVTLGATEKTQQEKPFPKLMIRQDSQDYTILLVTGRKGENLLGTCIHTTYSRTIVGEYCEEWTASIFTDYNEPITLQNQ